jgi:pyruvate carboxylase subunit B
LDVSDENIFIACAGDQKGIAFLKDESPLMIRKGENKPTTPPTTGEETMAGNYTVTVDGKQYRVHVAEGDETIEVTPANKTQVPAAAASPASSGKGSFEILSQTPGQVWKVLKTPGESVKEGETILILEAMKMEIEIAAPQAGTIVSVDVAINDSVQDGQLLATLD